MNLHRGEARINQPVHQQQAVLEREEWPQCVGDSAMSRSRSARSPKKQGPQNQCRKSTVGHGQSEN